MSSSVEALLEAAVREAERHVAVSGWDQNPRLFALVANAALLEHEPDAAKAFGITSSEGWTPVEQEELPEGPLDEVLASLGWPAEVDGVLAVLERVVLPPSVEDTLPVSDEGDDAEAAARLASVASVHPLRDEVRMAVGVLRDGTRCCVLRLRKHDNEDALLVGPDLVPGLADALRATFD